MPLADRDAVSETLANARRALLDARTPDGHWEGELSASALSTATALFALHLYREASTDASAIAADDARIARLVRAGLNWLALNQNADGGWGDTVKSFSNISTTALCWAAFAADSAAAPAYANVVSAAQSWLTNAAGGLEPNVLAKAIADRYGRDRTFSVPILTMCALAGRLGPAARAWRLVPQLPFELAAFPQRMYKFLHLPVVSYALPALIAIGQVRHRQRPTLNPITRAARAAARARTLRLLRRIQPASGGYLEATPLTSFVVMSLIGARNVHDAVVRSGIDFLIRSARDDGSWPIDTNLATWVTTLAVNALSTSGSPESTNESPAAPPRETVATDTLAMEEATRIRAWLLAQQYRTEHPYTLADPGGWAWTDLPGGVPDADDTPGALLALRHLRTDEPPAAPAATADGDTAEKLRVLRRQYDQDEPVRAAATAGVRWLLGLQNGDGGVPTFCRGWGKLPFDRSSNDLTAHALRAWRAWEMELPPDLKPRVKSASLAAVRYLVSTQRPDGSWLPLWFGNQGAPDDENPTYGTSRVLRAAFAIPLRDGLPLDWPAALWRATNWLVANQNADGGWGGGRGTPSSIEETGLAVESLAHVLAHDRAVRAGIDTERDDHWAVFNKMDEVLLDGPEVAARVERAVARGAEWLVCATGRGRQFPPTPIGFYFAKLWYFEKMYPLVFTVAALEQVRLAAGVESPSHGRTPGLG